MGEVPNWPLRSEWGIVFKGSFQIVFKLWVVILGTSLFSVFPCLVNEVWDTAFHPCGCRPVTDVGNLTRQGIINVLPAPALPPQPAYLGVCLMLCVDSTSAWGLWRGIKIGGKEGGRLGSLGFTIKWEKAYKIC